MTEDPVRPYRDRTLKELGLAGNHFDAARAHLNAYEAAVTERALAPVRAIVDRWEKYGTIDLVRYARILREEVLAPHDGAPPSG